MPLPVIADTYRVALNWEIGSGAHNAVNVIHIRDQVGTHDKDYVAAKLDEDVVTNMWKAVSDGAGVERIVITPLDGLSASGEYITGLPARWVGGTGGNPIPASASLVKILSDERGRSRRGRIFLPFVSEGAQNAGLIDLTTVATMETAWTDFLAALIVDDLELVVASYKLSEATPIVSCTVEDACGTQRRRQTRIRG